VAETTCKVCDVVTSETLTEHLTERHLNEMLQIETDPESGVSTIHVRA
jgi:hypothetical protein